MKVLEVWRHQGPNAAGRARLLVELDAGEEVRPGTRIQALGHADVDIEAVELKDRALGNFDARIAWLHVVIPPRHPR